MSRESIQWLNQNVKIGFGVNAWHKLYAESSGDPAAAEANHYPGAIPVADILRDLFNWEPVKVPSYAQMPDGTMVLDPNSFKIARPDTNAILGSNVGRRYQMHTYPEWLIRNVETILDADLAVSSVGLLRKGGLAWVAISLPHTLQIDSLDYRPQLVACTSLDRSTATSYRRSVVLPVCDNTLAASLSDRTDEVRLTHTSRSLDKVGEVRDALKLVYAAGDAFAEEVSKLLDQKVNDRRFDKWAQAYAGVAGKTKEEMVKGVAGTKYGALNDLWHRDERVTPWKGTAFGVLQTANTWLHWGQTVRGADGGRFERNQERVVRGRLAGEDRKAMAILARVK